MVYPFPPGMLVRQVTRRGAATDAGGVQKKPANASERSPVGSVRKIQRSSRMLSVIAIISSRPIQAAMPASVAVSAT